MSAQKTLSQLSFAIIALFIAAIPCFAQTETATTEQASASTQVAVVSNVRRTYRAESVVVAEAEVERKQPAFSAARFIQAVSESASLENKSNSTPTIVLNTVDTTKFNSEKPASSKRITFVTSKGHAQIPQ